VLTTVRKESTHNLSNEGLSRANWPKLPGRPRERVVR